MGKRKNKKKLLPSPVLQDISFSADPLIEGDCTQFNNLRVFTSKNDSVVYSFREHFLYFPWENKKSIQFSTDCPPASYHLEKRPDLKSFNFFEFRKSKTSVNLYRYARENKMCDDLLEYISDDVETLAKNKFMQHLTELRDSKRLTSIQESKPVDPLFPNRKSLEGFHYIQQTFSKSKFNSNKVLDNFKEFENWFNNLNDDLVNEVQKEDQLYIHLSYVDSIEDQLKFLNNKHHMLEYNSSNDHSIISSFIQSLFKLYYRISGSKFRIAIAASPSFGKTYLKNLFSGYNITDLDDISMFDPDLGPIFHKLLNARKWNEMSNLYHDAINHKFKEGLLLVQNAGQVPRDIPVISVVTPGPLHTRKRWSDRSLFDTVIKSRYKIFLNNDSYRNSLVQLIFTELYNSDNFK
jgi:hypothetical protein